MHHHQQQLNLIDFEWNEKIDHEAWEEKFQHLVKYKRKHGTTSIPLKDAALCSWVNNQCTNYKMKTLLQHRQQRLNSIDFEWNGKNVFEWNLNKWRKMYQRLIAYKKKYGTTSVPHGWKEDPQLANWVMNQHVAYSKCKLSQE